MTRKGPDRDAAPPSEAAPGSQPAARAASPSPPPESWRASSVPSSVPSSSRPDRGAGVSSEGGPAPGRGPARQLGVLSALGVLAAAVIMVCTNVLAARFYQRWDVTSGGLYTLSAPSLETLHGLSEPIEVVVFLSQSDPDFGGVERLLDQYEAESKMIGVRYVDPDRSPAEFIALSNRYRLSEGRAEGGHLVSDAAIVVSRGDARWVIGTEDILEYDETRGLVHPRVEQALTEGLRQVLDPTPTEVCFSTGQGEASLDDGGPGGLAALQHMLRKNNYGTRELDLGAASSELALPACDLIVVAAPRDSLGPAAVQKLVDATERGQALLISVGPALDDDSRARASGLEPLFDVFGVGARPGLIFEREPDAVLPVGLGGEAFLAGPRPHAITHGLVEGSDVRYRVLLSLAQALEVHALPADVAAPSAAVAVAPAVPRASAKVSPLLTTSAQAFGVVDAAKLAEAGVDLDSLEHDSQGPFTVALAAELPAVSRDRRSARLVLIGSGSPLLGGTWQDATLAGTRRFVESAVSWLVSRPTLVSVPEKPGRSVELRFTEESLAEVVRYVLVYMPGTALALGGLILLRRRSASAARVRAPGGKAP